MLCAHEILFKKKLQCFGFFERGWICGECEDQDVEGSTQDGEGSTDLHGLFFSLTNCSKVILKRNVTGWVMEHMPSVLCPNGKPLMPSTVCTWKKQMEREDNAPHTSEPPQKKKHGPKPSGEGGVVLKSKTNNTKVPDSLLCLLEGDDSGPVQC